MASLAHEIRNPLHPIQAKPDDGTVTLRVDSFAGNVRLAVSDTGPDLPHEPRPVRTLQRLLILASAS